MRRELFILAHRLYDVSFYRLYLDLSANLKKTYEELKEEQDARLSRMIRFAYENVPYYKKLFAGLRLTPEEIRGIEDLNKLPILTKEAIKRDYGAFKPLSLSRMKFYHRATGGSTGAPLKYRASKEHRTRAGVLLYRGWGYGGYELGDKIFFFAGESLGSGSKYGRLTKIHELARNSRFFSVLDMEEESLERYLAVLNKEKPGFIRGYASAINELARWIINRGERVHSLRAVFTTAEKLFPEMRRNIEKAFGSKVFDGYGLDDGGVTAYQCGYENNYHIDTENAVLEVVDEKSLQPVREGRGKVVATSLYNWAMPFIRYDTGDLAEASAKPCPCGRPHPVLTEVIGRYRDILITPEGTRIHGGLFTHIFSGFPQVKEFRVIQKRIDRVEIQVVLENPKDRIRLEVIEKLIKERSPNWKIEFVFKDGIEKTARSKHRFIVNAMN